MADLMKAIRAAHDAGDEDAARRLVSIYKAQQNQPETQWPDVPGNALRNLPKSIQGVGQGVIDTVTHPIDTAQGMLDLANAGMQKILPESVNRLMPESTRGNPEKLDAVGKFYADRYGSEEGIKQALSKDPAGVLMDATTLLSLGSAAIKPFAGKGRLNAQMAEIAKAEALNAPKAEILAKALKDGFTMPPSAVNPSFLNKRLESIAGKAAVRQDSVLRNQEGFVNPLVRRELGIPENQPISGAVLEEIRSLASEPYKQVAELPVPPSLAKGYSINSKAQSLSKVDLENLKQARNDAQGWRKAYERSASPDDLAKAKQAESVANELEARFYDRATQAGKPELMQSLVEGRKKIAQTYNVDAARNVATGDIDPAVLGRILDRNPKLLSGELKKIAETQQAFPQYLGDATKVPTPGVSKSEALASALMAGGGAASQGATGLLAGGIPLISEPVRNLLFSKWYQGKMTKFPTKKASSMARLQASLPNSKNPNAAALVSALYQMAQQHDGQRP